MKKIIFLVLIFSLAIFTFGQYNKYVAVGDSLTAGYMSGGLVETFQKNSYPALIARQIGISDFEQPLVSEPGIPALLHLVNLTPLIAPITTDPSQWGQPLNLNLQRPYDNLGVPGTTLGEVLNTVTDNGGMHDLILRGLGTQLQQAISLQPDLMTVWVGNNDILGAATSGTAVPGVTITPKDVFASEYDQLVATIKGNTQADVVLVNIPDVTSIPFVTTIPPFIINPQTGQVVTDQSGNPLTYLGQSDDGSPFISPNSYVLLTASAYLAQGYGIPAELGGNGQPLPDTVVLTPNEVATIEEYLNYFNSVISDTAQKYGCALLDIHTIFNNIAANGLEIGGIHLATDFLTGGFFGYDGVHPSALGYAIVANMFIDKINKAFGKNIPEVDLYPFVFNSPVCCLSGSSKVNPVKLQLFGLENLVKLFSKNMNNGGKADLLKHLGEINPFMPIYSPTLLNIDRSYNYLKNLK